MNSLEGWYFERDGFGWRWRYADPHKGGPERHCDQTFLTLLDCIHDAVKHGYVTDPKRRSGLG